MGNVIEGGGIKVKQRYRNTEETEEEYEEDLDEEPRRKGKSPETESFDSRFYNVSYS